MVTSEKVAVRSIVILTALGLLLYAVGIAYGYFLKLTAASLVHDLAGLTVGQSTYLDAERVANAYRHFRVQSWGQQPTTCSPEKCSFMFDLSNFLISKVRLVRPAVFRATVEVQERRVSQVDILFWGGPHGMNGALVHEAEKSSTITSGTYSFPTPVGKPYLRVFVSPAASAVEKQHAFTIDVSCLASWRKCDLGCDYLPLAWQDWKKELATWVDERSFLVSYPESNRCR